MRVALRRLDSVCLVTMGQAPTGTAYNQDGAGWPLLAGAGDFGDGVPQATKYTTEKTKLCAKNDVILGVRATIGVKVLADSIYCLGRGVAGLRPGPDLDLRFLWHWLGHIQPALSSRGKGATFKQVNREDIGSLEIPLPALSEQRRISEVLDRAEALRSCRRAAFELTRSLPSALFVEAFGCPTSSRGEWPLRELRALGRVATGGTPPTGKPGMFGGSVPFVTPGDLESGDSPKRTLTEAGASEVETVRAGAALVCCIGATIGKMGVASDRSAFNQQINAVEWSEEVDDRFGNEALRFYRSRIARWGASTTLPILKKSRFEKIQIPVPPIDLQRNFAQKVRAQEGLDAVQRASDSAMAALSASLQHRAFTGAL